MVALTEIIRSTTTVQSNIAKTLLSEILDIFLLFSTKNAVDILLPFTTCANSR